MSFAPEKPASRDRRPTLLVTAIVCAALVVPVLALINSRTRTGGDGLQGVGESVLAYGVLALASVSLAIAGWIRRERPWWLALVAIVLVVLPIFAFAV